MVQNVNYWYDGQIKQVVKHTLRVFSNFSISEGLDENNEHILRRVPITFMSSDKSVIYSLNKGTENIIPTCPKMILTINSLKLNTELTSGPAYEASTVVSNTKRWDEEIDNYVYDLGESITVTRQNPIPLGISFQLYIFTTMLDQKLQLFEQIRTIFTPELNLQTSENPLDWSRLQTLRLDNVNFSTRGTNLDSTQLDIMDMTFTTNINLDLPVLATKNSLVESIITDMRLDDDLYPYMKWGEEDALRTIYRPTENTVTIKDNKIAVLSPHKDCKDWAELLKMYRVRYNALKDNVYLHINITNDFEEKEEIIGHLQINPLNLNEAEFIFDESKLPKTTLKEIDGIINPHDFIKNEEDTRYLIIDDVDLNSIAWNNINDGSSNKAEKNSIIYKDLVGVWKVELNPTAIEGTYIVDDGIYRYMFDYEINEWVDVINGKYTNVAWKISSI